MGQPICVYCARLLNEGKPPRPWVQTTSQTDLAGIIASDLELGFQFVEAAKSAVKPENARAEIKRAREALHSARLFAGQVRGPKDWRRVQARANELEEAIRAFSQPLE